MNECPMIDYCNVTLRR